MKWISSDLGKQVVTLWQQYPGFRWGMSLVWLFAISAIAFFANLGDISLVDETEPLFAEAARQMTVTGDWITPFYNEQPRFDKPPLIYWLIAIAYQSIGVHEWATRLPSALSATGLVGVVFYVLLRFGQPPASPLSASTTGHFQKTYWLAAWMGATMMALHAQTIIWARAGVSDMLLSACVGTSLIAFFTGYAQPEHPAVQARWYWTFYIFMALAVLTKGPIGIVLPAFSIGSFLLYLGNIRTVMREMRLLPGLLLTLAISMPWYILVIVRNGEAYIASFFGYHNLERFTSVVNRHSAPWYFYFIIVLVGFTPWSTYLPAAIAQLQVGQRSVWRQQPRSAHLGLFALCWFLSIFGFFTIAVTKLPSYVLPLMPAAAILVGLLWSDRLTSPTNNRSFAWSSWGHILQLFIYAGVILYLPDLLGRDPAAPDYRDLIRQTGIPIIGAFLWGITALVELWFLWQHRLLWVWTTQVFSFILFLGVVAQPLSSLVDAQRQQPLRQLATKIKQVRRPAESIVMVGFKKPSLVFYSHQPIQFFFRGAEATAYLQQWTAQHPTASILVVAQLDRLPGLGLQPGQYHPILQRGGYQLIRVFARREGFIAQPTLK